MTMTNNYIKALVGKKINIPSLGLEILVTKFDEAAGRITYVPVSAPGEPPHTPITKDKDFFETGFVLGFFEAPEGQEPTNG